MPFTSQEKTALLKVAGVGPTVIKRLEEIGIESFAALKKQSATEVVELVASMLRTSCWKNSPKARESIRAAIVRANQGLDS